LRKGGGDQALTPDYRSCDSTLIETEWLSRPIQLGRSPAIFVCCRWALCIPAFIVLLTFVSHKISDRILVLQGAGKAKSQERQKLTEQQLAKARAQAEQANDRAEELEAKQRPRTVTAEQDAALRAAIHRLFASGLHVPINNRSKMLDPESENYTHQIAAALPRFRRWITEALKLV
jgi:hypothetical protein